jgi:hypothetical protein
MMNPARKPARLCRDNDKCLYFLQVNKRKQKKPRNFFIYSFKLGLTIGQCKTIAKPGGE